MQHVMQQYHEVWHLTTLNVHWPFFWLHSDVQINRPLFSQARTLSSFQASSTTAMWPLLATSHTCPTHDQAPAVLA